MKEIFIEAESLKNKGGWVVDQQSMETIHSSYIMAHGMGIPVADATDIFDAEAGEYNVWALTRDWTAVWNVKESAGKFNIAVNGKTLDNVLGTNGADWDWQFAGKVKRSALTPLKKRRLRARLSNALSMLMTPLLKRQEIFRDA